MSKYMRRRRRQAEDEGYVEVTVMMPKWQHRRIGDYARKYRTSIAGMLALIVAYYFGDGHDHLRCEHCVYGTGDTCNLPAKGEQTTIPPLDKGIVVVGHPLPDLGKRESTKSEQKFVSNGSMQLVFDEVE